MSGGRFELLDIAMRLAAHGLRPLPAIAAERHPMLRAWHRRATLDPTAIERMFRAARKADGIALATGCGLLVLDLDRNHGDDADGVRGFADLIAKHSDGAAIPPGPRQRTPRGGIHIFLAYDRTLAVPSSVGLAPGVDIRAQGGCVMTAPSMLPDGRGWRWNPPPWQLELPSAPTWLLKLICERQASAQPRSQPLEHGPPTPFSSHSCAYIARAVQSELASVADAPKGTRNANLFRAAAALWGLVNASALEADDTERLLVGAATHSGLVTDDGEAAVRRTIESAKRTVGTTARALPRPCRCAHCRAARPGGGV
jgi:hypothetical protein